MPRRSPSASRTALPEDDADVLDRVVRIHRGVAVAASPRDRAVRGGRGRRACGRETARPLQPTAGPPSRSIAELDPRLERRSGDVRPPLAGQRVGRAHADWLRVARIASSSSAKIALSSGRADRDAQAVRDAECWIAEMADVDAAIRQLAHDRPRIVDRKRTSRKFVAEGSGSTPGISRSRSAKPPDRRRCGRWWSGCSRRPAARRSRRRSRPR